MESIAIGISLPNLASPHSMQTERTQAAEGPGGKLSSEQFAELFLAAFAKLWGLATALIGDRNEAEDLVQEAAVVAFQKIDRFEPGSNFAAWMAKIVRMHAANWRRKKTGRRTAMTDPTDLDQQQAAAAAGADPSITEAATGETHGIQEGFDDVLLDNLMQLEETPRACLLLRIVHELGYDEIAALLDIPSGTAMSHVHRSKKRLRNGMAAQATSESSDPSGS